MRASLRGIGCAAVVVAGFLVAVNSFAQFGGGRASNDQQRDRTAGGEFGGRGEYGGGMEGYGGADFYGTGRGGEGRESGGGYGELGGEFAASATEDGEADGPFDFGGGESSPFADRSPQLLRQTRRFAQRREAEQMINDALDKPLVTDLSYVETPLDQITSAISAAYDIPIVFDTVALDSLAISPEVEVTVSLRNITLGAALTLLFREVEDLTYIVDNEVLLITSTDAAAERIQTRVYNVSDLVGDSAGLGLSDASTSTFDELIDALIANVEYDSWRNNGAGQGQISHLKPGMLVVTQTAAGHDLLADALAEIRLVRREIVESGVVASDTRSAMGSTSFAIDPSLLDGANSARDQVVAALISSVPAWNDFPADSGEPFLHIVGNRVLVRHTPAVLAQIRQAIRSLGLELRESYGSPRRGGFDGADQEGRGAF